MRKRIVGLRHFGRLGKVTARGVQLAGLLLIYALFSAKAGEAPAPMNVAIPGSMRVRATSSTTPYPDGQANTNPVLAVAELERLLEPVGHAEVAMQLPPTSTPTPFPIVALGDDLKADPLIVTISNVRRADWLQLGGRRLIPTGQWVIAYGAVRSLGTDSSYLYPQDFVFSVSSVDGFIPLHEGATRTAGFQLGTERTVASPSRLVVNSDQAVPLVLAFDVPKAPGDAKLWVVRARTGIELGAIEEIPPLWPAQPTGTPAPAGTPVSNATAIITDDTHTNIEPTQQTNPTSTSDSSRQLPPPPNAYRSYPRIENRSQYPRDYLHNDYRYRYAYRPSSPYASGFPGRGYSRRMPFGGGPGYYPSPPFDRSSYFWSMPPF